MVIECFWIEAQHRLRRYRSSASGGCPLPHVLTGTVHTAAGRIALADVPRSTR